MITFRYHLVSVIAVFLALALGVVVGSTLIDRAIVEGLEAQVDDVQTRLDERASEVGALRDEVTRLEDYAAESAPWTVAEQLDGTSVVVVAERGVERSAVEDLVLTARQAGGRVPGVYWLNESWALADETIRSDVADRLGVRDGDAAAVRARAWREVLNDLGTATLSDTEADEIEAAASTTTTTPPETVPPETVPGDTVPETTPPETSPPDTTVPPTTESTGAIAALAESGVLEFEAFGSDARDPLDLGGGRLRIILVGGPESDLAGRNSIVELAQLDVEEEVPTLVAEVHVEVDGGPERGSVVSMIRADDQLASQIATVDDLEVLQGRVAAVLGVSELGRGVVGHYGYGDGATRIVPEWTAPPPG